MRAHWILAAGLGALTLGALARSSGDVGGATDGDGWRSDPVWYDGLAEVCVYDASRTIYGKPRAYLARAYTDKERADPRTTTKSETDQGLEVFKHHWSEIVPTENYDYRFSTCTYTAAADMSAYKLTVGTQEDCGASFKLAVREGDALAWSDSVYFPGAGQRAGRIAAAADLHFVDELPLLLRDFPFAKPRELALRLVPSQKDIHQVSFEPFAARARHVGRETLDLPIGGVEAHHVRVEAEAGGWAADYWFDADGTAPRLHALVQYQGPDGQSCRLKSLVRAAYWKH